MAEAVSIKVDDKAFNKAFGRYMAWTSRDIVTAANTSAYFIARAACRETEKANKEQVKSSLVSVVSVQAKNRKGSIVTRRKRSLVRATKYDAPLAAVIIQSRRGKKGQKGLYGSKLRDAVRSLINARVRSVAYIKSGWLTSIRTLAGLADRKRQPPTDSTAKQVGRPKGSCTPAVPGTWMPAAKIVNEAYATRDKKDAFLKIGSRGLQRGIDVETASKNQYIEDKMRERAAEFNAS